MIRAPTINLQVVTTTSGIRFAGPRGKQSVGPATSVSPSYSSRLTFLTLHAARGDNPAVRPRGSPMQRKLLLTISVFAVTLCVAPFIGARQAAGGAHIMACRVLEVHSSSAPAVIVVLFHQRDKQDQPRFAALLTQNSGSTVAVQSGNSAWVSATVVRLKSCFGRGLLLLSPGSLAIKDGDAFRVKFSASSAAD